MDIIIPDIKRGNCLVFAFLFKINNPDSRFITTWSKKYHRPTFYCIMNEKKHCYRPNKKPTKSIWYEGRYITKSI